MALLAPGSFYEDFPASGRGWVSALPPYNEHLVRDVGALNLALAVLLGFAALSLEIRLVRISLFVWLVYAVPHFVYHLTELGAMPLLDDAASIAGLGLVVVLPLALLFLSRDAKDGSAEAASGSPATNIQEKNRPWTCRTSSTTFSRGRGSATKTS